MNSGFRIEERIESLIASGMTRAQAEAEMTRRFGDYRRYSEETRSIDVGIVRSGARRELPHNVCAMSAWLCAR